MIAMPATIRDLANKTDFAVSLIDFFGRSLKSGLSRFDPINQRAVFTMANPMIMKQVNNTSWAWTTFMVRISAGMSHAAWVHHLRVFNQSRAISVALRKRR